MATLTLSDELGAMAPASEARLDLKSRLAAYECGLIKAALVATGGNQRQAAQRLGVLPTTLHEKMKRLGVRAEVFIPGVSAEALAAAAVTGLAAGMADPADDSLHS